MTLQSNGAISFSNLQTEFGGSNPISLSEYYRGGAYVPSSSSVNIPTSGAIKLSNFYGATRAIDSQTVNYGFVDGLYEYEGSLWYESTIGYNNATRTLFSYQATPSMGSINDGTFNPISNAQILYLVSQVSDYNGTATHFGINGSFSNSGWTAMAIGNTVYTRASASYAVTNGITSWVWYGAFFHEAGGTSLTAPTVIFT